jgi:G3E family GTPase
MDQRAVADARTGRPALERYLNIKGSPERFVFQAVHMLMEGDDGKRWQPDERRDSKMVFIGRNLDPAELRAGFAACLAA